MSDKINWIEVLPSWIQTLGIIGIFFLVLDRIDLDYKDTTKASILETLSQDKSSKGEKELLDGVDSKLGLVALYELMADKVILKTAQGYEITRHRTRLFDDIDIIVSYELKKISNSKEETVSFVKIVDDAKKALVDLEVSRKNNMSESYINKLDYYIGLIIIKKLTYEDFTANFELKNDNGENDISTIFTSPLSYSLIKTSVI